MPAADQPPTQIALIPIDRLPGVMDIWLWEFESPENWPAVGAVRTAMTEICDRDDGTHPKAVEALAKCRDYLSVAEGLTL